MAPEYVRGDDLDRRAEVVALGVVLWEALCGRRLFHGKNEGETLCRACSRQARLRRSRTAAAELVPLDAVVARALHRDRDARFGTAAEMARALELAATPPAWIVAVTPRSWSLRSGPSRASASTSGGDRVTRRAGRRRAACRHPKRRSPLWRPQACRPRSCAARRPISRAAACSCSRALVLAVICRAGALSAHGGIAPSRAASGPSAPSVSSAPAPVMSDGAPVDPAPPTALSPPVTAASTPRRPAPRSPARPAGRQPPPNPYPSGTLET